MRKTIVALLALPAVALGQGPSANPPGQPDPARAEKRMRLARTLGLAELLDLEPAQALKLGEALGKFDERRRAAGKQAFDATEVLRKVASGGDARASGAEVDGAIKKLLDAQLQLQAIDRETLQTVTKDLSPEQKARATLFLSRFRDRIERRIWMMHRGGPGGPGMGRGMMMDRPGRGMQTGPPGDDRDLEYGQPFGDDEN